MTSYEYSHTLGKYSSLVQEKEIRALIMQLQDDRGNERTTLSFTHESQTHVVIASHSETLSIRLGESFLILQGSAYARSLYAFEQELRYTR